MEFTILISVISTVVSGMILFFIQRFFAQQRAREEHRDKTKSKEYALILRSLKALGKLTVANTIALRDGRTNGETSSALREYEEVEKELYEHLITVHADVHRT